LGSTQEKTVDKPVNEFLQYGGQAVIEGVMMRSPRYFAVACRKPDGGIVVQEEPVDKSIIGKLKWMNRPLLRGTLALIDAMALGLKALNFAANVQAQAIEEGSNTQVVKPSKNGTEHAVEHTAAEDQTPIAGIEQSTPKAGSRINDMVIAGTMAISICFGVALFVALPTLLTQLVQGKAGIPQQANHAQQIQLNLIDGLIRITIFLGYIALISRLENIRRVFQFHGAEHKAINTLEAGEPLTVESCMRASRIHPRCGTSFIIVVLLAGILVHSVFPRPDHYLVRLSLHIALIPFVAGIGYEIIKLAGKYRNLAVTHILLAPGLWSQRLTTREPAAEHVEVALAALLAVLNKEREETAAVAPAQEPAPAVA
jgi:uncharacterized protein YqhQ